ncbi:GNAT family N-acetyltransferase [Paenibacillus sp. sgz5001063]|uniref:GNAT family N-acetyltransferase n=1 Tax=Paenibacillus sp. sgz5001063 TaxID=3242474 RepID=UPI0036D338D4
MNPFEHCPIYETDHLVFTKVKEEDAKDLFECYSDPITKGHMNNDNCGGEWDCPSIDNVRQGINAWNKEFDARFFIRWSVRYKQLNKVIGTIELAPIPNTTRFLDGVCQSGILRIDIISSFEDRAIFSEILQIVTDHFYIDFGIDNIITKVTTDDIERIQAVEDNHFIKLEDNPFIPFDNYYLKKNKD